MELFNQLLWNGLVTGSLIALVSLGLTLVYGVAGFIQFAHGEFVALGAYFFLVFHKVFGWPLLPAGVTTVLGVILLGIIIERVFFRRVRDQDSMIPLVISIGLSILIQSLILIIWGPNILTISEEVFSSQTILEGTVLATPPQILALVSAFVLMGGVMFFLRKTRTGKMLRAVSCNRSVAEIFGMSPDVALRWIFGIGAGLAAIAGIFLGFEQNLEPLMGVQISVKAFSAVILGAVGSVRGAILGAFIIGFAESFLVGYGVVPSGFTSAIPFVILIGMLLVRPVGIFGNASYDLRK